MLFDLNTQINNYKIINDFIKIIDNDIQNYDKLNKAINEFKPDYIFHLAAQSLVKKSYKQPFETWKTNLNGTLNILEIFLFHIFFAFGKKDTVVYTDE